MPLPETSRLQFTLDLNICRILNGLWQVSGAHGPIDPDAAISEMLDYVDTGFTTWDLADHYGPAEDFIGQFRRQLTAARGQEALSEVQAFTKWVPQPGRMTRTIVEDNINLALRRMDVDAIDLLQFHWWEYQNPNYLDALGHLSALREQGKLKHVALTNFDTSHLATIVNNGIRIVSNQVQFSLIDRRPELHMIPFCQHHDVQLLTYGTLCGGLLSETYLGQPEPTPVVLNTASLRKYKQMIDVWGGWDLFQELLGVLKQIANKHQTSIASVSMGYILDRPSVAGVIIGTRLGISEHRSDNACVFEVTFDAQDLTAIHAVLERANDLYERIGDCGDEYRN